MRISTLSLSVLLAGCLAPTEDWSESDLRVGHAEIPGLAVDVPGGAAAVTALAPGGIGLRAAAPGLSLDVTTAVASEVEIGVANALPDALLGGAPAVELAAARPTERRFRVTLPAGTTTLTLAAPDAAVRGPFRFAVMGDLQGAIDRFPSMRERIDAAAPRFLLFVGDLSEDGSAAELDRVVAELAELACPTFATPGNHDLGDGPELWAARFGRATSHFEHRGVAFSLAFSGGATIDPLAGEWLDGWLTEHAAAVHVFATHYPLFDPVGVRGGGFRSRREAAALAGRLGRAGVDLALHGHVHSYYLFGYAGVPAHIVGGGGATIEPGVGVGRHFLVVDVDADAGVTSATVVRVDRE